MAATKSALYRGIRNVRARTKRQYRLQLRPGEVLAEGDWRLEQPTIEEVNAALHQLNWWGTRVIERRVDCVCRRGAIRPSPARARR